MRTVLHCAAALLLPHRALPPCRLKGLIPEINPLGLIPDYYHGVDFSFSIVQTT